MITVTKKTILYLAASWFIGFVSTNSLSRYMTNLENELVNENSNGDIPFVDDAHLQFTGTPQSVEVQSGHSLVLECGANGVPQAKIHWLRNGKRIQQSAHEDDDSSYEKLLNVDLVTIQNSITMSKLKIDCAMPAASGQYSCVADNGYQKIESPKATVKIIQSQTGETSNTCANSRRNMFLGQGPEIYMWTDSRFEISGATVQLFCRAKGYPEPVIYWLDNEEQAVTDTKKYAVLSNGDLLIKNVDWDMMGQFTCVASNEFGEDKQHTFLYPTKAESSASSESLR